MQVVHMESVEKTQLHDPIFTAARVKFQALVPESLEFQINIVHFGRGVRNKLHCHSTEQVLIVTAGIGIVATETEARTVGVGDLVRIPAGENHWHGATDDSEFSHLYIMPKQSDLTQLES